MGNIEKETGHRSLFFEFSRKVEISGSCVGTFHFLQDGKRRSLGNFEPVARKYVLLQKSDPVFS